jgi:hypothetical protein
MPETTLPPEDLTQQIAQWQSELERLRQEYEARQARLRELTRQRDELQATLRQIEADIRAVTQGLARPASPPPAAVAEPAAPAPANKPNLTEALVRLVRQAGRPLTARELGEQLVRSGFPTKSTNITNLVQNRLSELVKRGVFRQAAGQPGVILAQPGGGARAAAAKAPPKAPTAPPSRPGLRKGQPPLRSLLTELLKKSRKPVAAKDLAAQVAGDRLPDQEQGLHRRGLDRPGPAGGRRERQGAGLAPEEGLTAGLPHVNLQGPPTG